MTVAPTTICGSSHRPLNRARAASTAWVSGLSDDRVWSQSGASVIGSKIPDSRSSGRATPWTIGASASSLLITSARVYDSSANVSPTRATMPSVRADPARDEFEAERDGDTTMSSDRLDDQDRHVAQRPTGEHREAAHRRHPHPLDDAVAELGDETEAGEGRREERRS